jgi:hypothetical protein
MSDEVKEKAKEQDGVVFEDAPKEGEKEVTLKDVKAGKVKVPSRNESNPPKQGFSKDEYKAEGKAKDSESEELSDGSVSVKDVRKQTQTIQEHKPAQIDNQRVVLNRKITCFIGGEFYTFMPNKAYKVSSQVKKVLIDRGVVIPSY